MKKYIDEVTGECLYCDASGECPRCQGDGDVDEDDCPTCQGTGDCPNCKGKGRVKLKRFHNSRNSPTLLRRKTEMKLELSTTSVTNYRGHCIGAIADSDLPDRYKQKFIAILPAQVSADEYAGFSNIIDSDQSYKLMLSQIRELFGASWWVKFFDTLVENLRNQ